MQFRTDLAAEAHQFWNGEVEGAELTELENKVVKATRLIIHTEKAAEQLGKPKGTYITFENLALSDDFTDAKEKILAIADEIRFLLPSSGSILAVGLGNINTTPDAIGPKSTQYILATRHIQGEWARAAGLDILRPVSVISPGVLGQTGIEAGEMILSLVERLHPAAVIVIDALASRNLSRLGCTVQICDSGIVPGSGVGNYRFKLDKESLGIPVIAVGIPTVVDALTLACDILNITDSADEILGSKITSRSENMIVTPREIDLLTERGAKLIGSAVNCALQSSVDYNTLMSLVS